jgi:uncharacterized protein (DUF1810 family)
MMKHPTTYEHDPHRYNAHQIARCHEKDDPYDLQRFVVAQEPVFAIVRAELQAGRKTSHWMWYIFPQIKGLGQSRLSRTIASRAEAGAILNHPVLGPRLVECTRLVILADAASIDRIFDDPDDLKFFSSMTLFAQVANDGSIFHQALRKYFHGDIDKFTLDRMQGL